MRAVRDRVLWWGGIAVGVLIPACAWAGADITINSPSVVEGNSGTTTLPFTITRSGDAGSQIILQFQTGDDTATAPSDYITLPDTELTTPAGASSARVNVTVNGDTAVENDETLFLRLANATAVGTAPSFSGPFNFEAGNPNLNHRPRSVTLGDINGDGRLDMAVANGDTYDVGVLLNTTTPGATAPSFANPVSFFAPAPLFVTLGDVNGDGKLDLVVSNASSVTGDISVRINTTTTGAATPSFADPVDVLPRSSCGASKVGLADINGDSREDIVVACSTNGTVVVLLNNTAPGASMPSFSNAGSTSFVYTFSGLALGDFNNDGRPDLVLTNVGGRAFVLLNTTAPGASSASFGAIQTFSVGGADIPTDVSIGDINGDGRPDLAISIAKEGSPNNPNARDPRVAVLLNATAPGAAAASFTVPREFLTDGNAEAVALSDVNGDNRPDLVVSEGVNGAGAFVQTFLNTTPPGAAMPRFSHAGSVGVGGSWYSIAAGDLNGDGKPDVAMADISTSHDKVSVLLNTTVLSAGTLDFAAASAVAAGANPSAVVAGDINGDGMADLAVASSGDNLLSVLLGTTTAGSAAASYAAASNFAVGADPSSITLRDFNGDGRPDLATANANSNNVSVLLNTTAPGASAPGFAGAGDFAVGTAPRAVATGDLNGDGKPDLTVANSGGNNVSVLFNTTVPGSSSAGFAAAGDFAAGAGPASIALGDLNGDGRPDLAVANQAGNTLSVLLNTTTPGAAAASFAAASTFAVGSGPISLAIADLNGDGRLDLVAANQTGGSVSVLLNTTAPGAASASFSPAANFTAGSGPAAVVLRDVNGDGRPDLVVANGASHDVSVLLNATAPGSSSASFTAIGNFAVGTNPRSVFVGDVNGDGQRDLLVANGGSNSVSVLLNQMFTVTLLNSEGRGTILDDDTDRIPNAFTFTDQSGVAVSTVVTSNAITISGINTAAPISVTGGEYSIDGGAFTGAAANVSNGQSVRVRHTSASTHNTATNTALSIGGVSDAFTSTTAAADATPDAFTFNDQSDVATSTVVTSNSITVSAINAVAPISVTGGEYSVNGDSFTNAAGSVTNGQTVRVRHTSAAAASTPTNTALTIGGVSGTFTSTTAAADTTPDAFAFTDQSGVQKSAVVMSNSIAVFGINAAAAISVTGGEYSVNGGPFTNAAGSVSNGQSVQVRHTSSASYSTATHTVLTVGGVSDIFTSITGAATPPSGYGGGGGSLSAWEGLAGLLLGLLTVAGSRQSRRAKRAAGWSARRRHRRAR